MGLLFACSLNRDRRITAHFHAYYQSEIGIFGIDPVEFDRGFFTEEAETAGGSVGGVTSS